MEKRNPYEGTQTEKNLEAAFAGESQARNKYTYFASAAKKEGYEQIAALFLQTADNEKEHAKLWFKELKGIGNTAQNLAAAADGNVQEWTLDVSSSGSGYVDSFGVDWQPGVVVVDPTGPTTGSAFVFRGGSFSKDAAYCRVTCRSLSRGRWDTPGTDEGMRMALMDDAE